MSLLNKANAAPAPTTTDTGGFEEMEDHVSSGASAAVATSAQAQPAAATPAPAPAPAAAAAPAVNLGSAATANVTSNVGNSTAVVVPPKDTALAVSTVKKRQVQSHFQDRKNAIEVDYNTLKQLFPNNGNIVDRETTTMLGDEIVFSFLSYQDAFVVSPENDEAPDEVVRYSDDGIICSDGTPVEEHLQWLQDNGYPKARVKNRNVVVGLVEQCAKQKSFEGRLVQIDLPPSSKVMWDRYGLEALYAVRTNRMTGEQADLIRMTVTVTKKKDNIYTQAGFEAAHLKAPN